MNQQEFLRELEIGLAGKLPPQDLAEVLSDYRDIFREGGPDEVATARRLGSPAAICKAILEEGPPVGATVAAPPSRQLASVGRRMAACAVDVLSVALVVVMLFAIVPFQQTGVTSMEGGSPGASLTSYENRNGEVYKMELKENGKKLFSGKPEAYDQYAATDEGREAVQRINAWQTVSPASISSFSGFGLLTLLSLLMPLALGGCYVVTALELAIFRGYTLGKWLLGIRVEAAAGGAPGLGRSLVRDGVIKGIGGIVSGGLIHLASLVLVVLSSKGEAIHDMAAGTVVVRAERKLPWTHS